MVVIEVKVPGETPEQIQFAKLDWWREAGAIALWTDNADQAYVDVKSEVENRLGYIRE